MSGLAGILARAPSRVGRLSVTVVPRPLVALSVLFIATATMVTGQAPPPGPRPHLAEGAGTTADTRLLQAIDLYTGVAGYVDDAEARRLLVAAAEPEDDPLAVMWIARVFSRGRMTFTRDEDYAREVAGGVIEDVRDLAAVGDVEASFLMGTAYDEGLGVDVDHAEAMRWYRRAADQGHVLAAHNVGNMYRDGRGVETDPAAAVRWWLRAARAGDAIPALRLGEAFESGYGVAMDRGTARFWYGQAAERGNVDAAEALERVRTGHGSQPTAQRPAHALHDGRRGRAHVVSRSALPHRLHVIEAPAELFFSPRPRPRSSGLLGTARRADGAWGR